MLLSGKTAVVTGCNRGIGRAALEAIVRHGASVFACVRQPSHEFSELVGKLTSEFKTSIIPIYFDLCNGVEVKEGAKRILAAKAPIDVIVNNAGEIHTGPFAMTTEETMRASFDVNFFAPVMFTQLLCRTMVRQKRGSIINIASSAAIDGNEGRTAYAGAKAALIASTKVMARELGLANIRVNAIAPGLTQTDMMVASTPQKALEQTVERISMKRIGRPDEIAGSILYLASDLSTYVTGQVLRVDGGM